MIRLFVGLVVRVLVELALVLFVFAGLFLVLAYRAARMFATPTPDKLDKLAGGIAQALGLVAARSVRREPELDDEDELDDDPAVEQVEGLVPLDWREQAI